MFALALTASDGEVQDVIESIEKFFGAGKTETIAPQQIAQQMAEEQATPDAAPAFATGTLELDKNGLPWDERIHSGNHGKNADGTWRYRRGLDEKLKAKVVAELTKTMGAGLNNPSVALADTTPAPVAATLPPIPGMPSLGVPELPTLAPQVTAYSKFVEFVVANTRSDSNPTGRLTDEYVSKVLQHFGVADGSMQNLAHREDLIPQIEAGIKQALGL